MKKTVIISGSGGQGVMSAGVMIAQAAVHVKKHATYLPEYGPEQRGGSAKCTVVVSEEKIISPLAQKCDFFIALNEQGFAKFKDCVKPGGLMILNSSRVTSSVERDDVKVIEVAADDLSVKIGNPKCANIIMIGALVGFGGVLTEDEMTQALMKKFEAKKPEVLEMNIQALKMGIELAK